MAKERQFRRKKNVIGIIEQEIFLTVLFLYKAVEKF